MKKVPVDLTVVVFGKLTLHRLHPGRCRSQMPGLIVKISLMHVRGLCACYTHAPC